MKDRLKKKSRIHRSSRTQTSTEALARNFVDNYGHDRLRWMVDQLIAGASYSEIGRELGVSRQRVQQWSEAFGVRVQTFLLYPDLDSVLAAEE